MEDERMKLVIVLDTSLHTWGRNAQDTKATKTLNLWECLRHIHTFINAFLLINRDNQIGLIACHNDKSYFIPLISLGERDLFFDKEANKKPEKRLGREGILSDLIESIRNIYKKTQDAPNVCSNTVALSSSFSQALCLLHRLEDIDKGCTLKNRRVLFIHGAEDVPGQYVPMMNASFCAKKMNVLVDACVLNEKDSNFLQQAASISGGVYYNPSEELERMKKPALSQYLVNIFLANPKTRKIMQLPKTHTSALKVSCFLSQRPIDMGFVCSVCLSIFSSKMEKCAICETVFQNTRSLKRKTLIG